MMNKSVIESMTVESLYELLWVCSKNPGFSAWVLFSSSDLAKIGTESVMDLFETEVIPEVQGVGWNSELSVGEINFFNDSTVFLGGGAPSIKVHKILYESNDADMIKLRKQIVSYNTCSTKALDDYLRSFKITDSPINK